MIVCKKILLLLPLFEAHAWVEGRGDILNGVYLTLCSRRTKHSQNFQLCRRALQQ